jgi:pimeloyl-ACP methyl ester carboxylesterase
MLRYRQWFSHGLWTIVAVLFTLGVLMAPRHVAQAAANALVTTDYFVSHTSIEPFYAQYNLDPHVVLHVREVVLAGRERTAPKDGKILLLVHGNSIPGDAAFDLDYANCSMMRYFARAGWDTFTFDIEGYGRSTRPPVMDAPSAFPESKAPIHTEVAVNDVERVVAFITHLRGVDKVYLLGWSMGASRTAPLYTIRHPEQVTKLVLVAPGYKSLGWAEPLRDRADAFETKIKILYNGVSLQGWSRFGSNEAIIVPGALEAVWEAIAASDPKSGELGGRRRSPAGRLVDMLRAKVQFDASQITVPTLVIRGVHDTFATQRDSQLLVEELGSEVKQYVEIPDASHLLPYEKGNAQYFNL